MQIGKFKLDNPFILAPLAGITDKTFRKLCLEKGAALVFSEMVSAKALHFHDKKTEALLEVAEGETSIGFQLFGSEPEIFKEAAYLLEDRTNSLIDINMGCPVPKVIKNGEGSALMKTPELAAKIVETLVANTKKPVTVKMRIGWETSNINAVDLALILESAGASAITVHGRTRDQYYSGRADWDVIAKVKSVLKIPVFGNGDIYTGVDAVNKMKESGVDGVMIARGALGNPWIFNEAISSLKGESYEPPGEKQRIEECIRHANLLKDDKGEHRATLIIRKHVAWYTRGIKGAAKLRARVNLLPRLEDVISELRDFQSSVR